jgi:hypothetical protein
MRIDKLNVNRKGLQLDPLDEIVMLIPIAAAFLLLTALALLRRRRLQSAANPENLPLPPGPKGHFLLGNLLQIPRERYWIQLEKWAREFGMCCLCYAQIDHSNGITTGPIYTLNVLGTPVIVTTTSEAGTDLLEKRSAKYSDRPRWIMANDILTKGMHVGVTRYGER